MIRTVLVKIVLVFLWLLKFINPTICAQTCYMPDYSYGQCLTMNNCPSFVNNVKNSNGYFENSFCGYDGFNVMICCPSQSHNIPSYSSFNTENLNSLTFGSLGTIASQQNPSTQLSAWPASSISPPSAVPSFNVASSYFSSLFNRLPFNSLSQSPSAAQASSISVSPATSAASTPINYQTSLESSTPSKFFSAIQSVFSSISNLPKPSLPMPPIFSSSSLLNFLRPTNNQCGLSGLTNTRIVGGILTRKGKYPWITALGYRVFYPFSPELQFNCAGSLITQKYVITSAHCISNDLYVARLGEYDLSSADDDAKPIDIVIENKIIHEQYDRKLVINDIGLLKLRNNAPINDRIRPICLPTQEPIRSSDLNGYTVDVIGWGATSYQGQQSNVLRETRISIVPLSECARSYHSLFPQQIFDNRVICAGRDGRDTCQGDSGGPLMLQQNLENQENVYFILIGIVSYGYECAKDDFPGVYTRVSSFLPWIQQHLS